MSQFLVDVYEAVERLTSIKTVKDDFYLNKNPTKQTHIYSSQEHLHLTCKARGEEYNLRVWPKFRAFTVQQIVDFVYKNKFYNNCLGSSHTKANCKSKNTYIYYKKTHYSQLHMTKASKHPPQEYHNSHYKGSSNSQ